MFNSASIRKLVQLALEEDSVWNDLTSLGSVSESSLSKGYPIAKEQLIVCGLPLIPIIIEESRFNLTFATELNDGARISVGSPLCEIAGRTRDLLALERTILNFLQRMCGVATHTDSFLRDIPKALTVLDTRKTMPGWRELDKYSVRIGGGKNHRMNLSDMILVKNNHVDNHAEGLLGVLNDLKTKTPAGIPVEVEVRDQGELEIALKFTPNFILLDHFSDKDIPAAVKVIRASSPKTAIEVSGGITKERAEVLAKAGIDSVSVGTLTTKATNVDISMRIEPRVYA